MVTELGSGRVLCLGEINLASAPDGVEMGDRAGRQEGVAIILYPHCSRLT